MKYNEMIKEFIKYNILNNAYYEQIKDMYDVADDDEQFITHILHCFENFNSYFSIYTIMDSIVSFIEEHDNIYKIEDVVYSDAFEIIDC